MGSDPGQNSTSPEGLNSSLGYKVQEDLGNRRDRVLSKSVGPRGINEPEDINKVQSMLAEKGHLEEVSGYIGTKMVDATKAYQKENDLKVDGQINPGGPTEASLFGEKKGQVKTPTSTPLGGVSINNKMDNSRAANAERDKSDENSNVGIYTGWDKTKIDENEWHGDDNA